MDVNDTARVRHPISPIEYRLATIVAVEAHPDGLHGHRYWLRFPSGDRRTYLATEITPSSRDDDRQALVTTMTAALRSLAAACRIAHDYDDELSAEIVYATGFLVDTARTRLGVTLDLVSPGPEGCRS